MKRTVGEFELEVLGAYPWREPNEEGLRAFCRISGKRVITTVFLITRLVDSEHVYGKHADSQFSYLTSQLISENEMDELTATQTSHEILTALVEMADSTITKELNSGY